MEAFEQSSASLGQTTPGHLLGAFRLHQQGDLTAAEAGYREILARDPGDRHALHLLGLLLRQSNRLAASTDVLMEAAAREPLDALVQKSLGDAFAAQKFYPRAIEAYRKALVLEPDAVDAMIGLGEVLVVEQRYEEAAGWFTRALGLHPGSLAGCLGLGKVLRATRQFESADRCYRLALRLDPAAAQTYAEVGELRLAEGRAADAVEWFEKSLALQGGNPAIINSLGNALRESGRHEEAMETYQRALSLAPGEPAVFFNLACLYAARCQYSAAIEAYERATQLNPGYAEAHANKALLQLLIGDLQAGWQEYEWRFKLKDPAQAVDTRTFECPLWKGTPFPGKSLLLRSEQGAGDMIQFCRYAPLVKERGGRVILECPPKLERLLHSIPGVDEFVGWQTKAKGNFDLYVPLLSVPRFFSPSMDQIPAPVPYLAAEPGLVERTRPLLRSGTLNIGLCWQGNRNYKGDVQRSIPLRSLLPLLQVQGVNFYSLQKGEGSEQLREIPEGLAPADLGAVLDNGPDAFCETAAAMYHLDLIISSDTAVAHLAGALGRPVWLMVAHTPEWRWFLGRSGSPWYPTMRIFRQRVPGDWGSAAEDACRELRQQISLGGLRHDTK